MHMEFLPVAKMLNLIPTIMRIFITFFHYNAIHGAKSSYYIPAIISSFILPMTRYQQQI